MLCLNRKILFLLFTLLVFFSIGFILSWITGTSYLNNGLKKQLKHSIHETKDIDGYSSVFDTVAYSRFTQASEPKQQIEEGTLKGSTQIYFNGSKLVSVSLPIPAFYINMAYSVERRRRMEAILAGTEYVIQVEGVMGINQSVLESYLPQGQTKDEVEEYFKSKETLSQLCTKWEYCGKIPSFGEIGAFLSHLKAMNLIQKLDLDYGIIFEDDVGIDISPFWTISIEELIQLANVQYPNWGIIRLAILPFTDNVYLHYYSIWERGYHSGKIQHLAPVYYKNPGRVWSIAAYIVSRRGVQIVMDKFHVGEGRFNITQLYAPVPDWGIHDLIETTEGTWNLMSLPPMFVYMDGEDSAGAQTGKPSTVNRHWKNHQVYRMLTLKWATEDWERHLATKLNITPHSTTKFNIKLIQF